MRDADLEPPSFLADNSELDIDSNRDLAPVNLTEENSQPEKQDTSEKEDDSMEKYHHNTISDHHTETDSQEVSPICTPNSEKLKSVENKIERNQLPCPTPAVQNGGHAGKLVNFGRGASSNQHFTNLLAGD